MGEGTVGVAGNIPELQLDPPSEVACPACLRTGRINLGGLPGSRSEFPLDDPICPECEGAGHVYATAARKWERGNA